MSFPPGTEGEPNTTISSAKYNAMLLDLLGDLNTPRPVSAGGTGVNNLASLGTALGLKAAGKVDVVTVELGGTGKTTAAEALAALGGAALAGPTTFTGNTVVPDQPAGSNNGRAANTRYVDAAAYLGSVAGMYSGLSVEVTSSAAITIQAGSLSVVNAAGGVRGLRNINVDASLNTLDTGTKTNSRWYYIHVFYNPTTGDIVARPSLNASAPTAPAGYTFRTRVGTVRSDSDGNLWRTIQKGVRVYIACGDNPSIYPVAASGVAGATSGGNVTLETVSLTAFIPPTAVAASVIAFNNWKNGTRAYMHVAPNVAHGGANRGLNGSAGQNWLMMCVDSSFTSMNAIVDLVTPQQIAWASDGAGGAIAISGWLENL